MKHEASGKPLLPPVVVGAGPSGVRAACTLVEHGLSPIVIDEGMYSGGQIYRRQPAGFVRSPDILYGFEARKARSLHGDFDRIATGIDYRSASLVWNAQSQAIDVWHIPSNSTSTIAWSEIIVATGATDRVLPVPGWTLPGVYTLGGAQVALKFQACAIGRQVVFAGTGPLLYLVAYQYAKAGAKVVAVIDSAKLGDQIRAVGDLARQPGTLLKGMYYVAWLQAQGVQVVRNARLLEISGDTGVRAISWICNEAGANSASITGMIECDAVGLGYALRSETQLADLLECEFGFDAMHRAHLPKRDSAGRSSQRGVYLAGDGAGIMGADAAELAGERAALALLSDRGISTSAARAVSIESQLRKISKWRRGMEAAFPFPSGWAEQASNDLVVCRCENITVGELRAAVNHTGACEINRLKALTRVGMGRCQGRMCSTAAIEVLSHTAGLPVSEVGRLRAQAPIKPLPMNVRVEEAMAGDRK